METLIFIGVYAILTIELARTFIAVMAIKYKQERDDHMMDALEGLEGQEITVREVRKGK